MGYTEEQRAYHRRYYHEKRRKPMIDYLGGKCVRCGSVENLQFDHINRESKSFDISTRLNFNDPEVRAELDKCQLLCKPCHERKTSAEVLELGFRHGTSYAWMKRKCKCDECQAAKWKWRDARNSARRTGGRGPYRTARARGEIR